MNRQLTIAELASLLPVMTKRDKLLRLAQIVRAAPHNLASFNNVEYMSPTEKRLAAHPNSAFALAAADSILKDAGLQSGSVYDSQCFFDLSNRDLHEFSCDCGGQLSNEQMAYRIETLAARA